MSNSNPQANRKMAWSPGAYPCGCVREPEDRIPSDTADVEALIDHLRAENTRLRGKPGHQCRDSCAHTFSMCEKCGTWVRASRHASIECDEIAKLRKALAAQIGPPS